MGGKPYTPEEVAFIEDNWGVISIKSIANKLGRSIGGIENKANKIGLDDARMHIDGITIFQLSKVLGISYGIIFNHWIPEHGFPISTKIVAVRNRCKYVTYEKFWKWAEKNKNLLNFVRMEEGILGEEPSWVKEKRKADNSNVEKVLKRPWTDYDKRKLISLVKLQRYTYAEISEMLQRSPAAINRKLWEWKVLDMPLGTDKRPWTNEEISKMFDMREKGYGWNTIGKQLGRSLRSAKGKYERVLHEMEGQAI